MLIIKTPEQHYWQLWTYFAPFSSVSIAEFEQLIVCWVVVKCTCIILLSSWYAVQQEKFEPRRSGVVRQSEPAFKFEQMKNDENVFSFAA